MKKTLSLILCLVMVLSLAACAAPAVEETTAPAETGETAASTEEAGDKPFEGQTIRVILASHDWTTAIESKLSEFIDKTGIKLEFEVYPEDQLSTKLNVELASGGTYIDVFMCRPLQEVQQFIKGYNIGDRVTFDSTVYCNKCDACKRGDVNLCADRQVLGVSCGDYRRDGCFAEYVTVPEYILYRIPENVTFVQASMTEPLSIAMHAATRTKITAEDTVAVIGVGTIGILILQVVKSFGAKRIIALDIDDGRLEFAKKNGAADIINSKAPDAAQRLAEIAPTVAIDATGIPATFDMCVKSVVMGGRVVMVGNLAQHVDFPLQYAVTHQLSFFGSCASSGEYPACLKLIAEGKVDIDGMISKVVPLCEGDYWLNKVYRREDGLTKIVFCCNEE